MYVDTELDGGSIEIVNAANPHRIELRLRPDTQASFRQWFCFRVRLPVGQESTLRILDAGASTYGGAWEGYRACVSTDGRRWSRAPTTFDGEALAIHHLSSAGVAMYGYFAPYPAARRAGLIHRARRSPRARVDILGASVQDRPVARLVFGDPAPRKPRVWIIARQHPGETMAEWFAEGAIERLLDRRDDLAAALCDEAVISVVPCVNPDGGVLGNQRTNAAGVDLNRAWDAPGPGAPEVAAVRAAMLEEGVDLLLDVHGDEQSVVSFAAGAEGNPGYTPRLEALEERFIESLAEREPTFTPSYVYPPEPPGTGELRVAGNWAAEVFDCLSLTLEMPFRDPEGLRSAAGFSPRHASRFGARALESVFEILGALR